MLARLSDDIGIALDEGGTYRFHGGHRLWAAPEVPSITYAPDNHDCDVTINGEELTISAGPDAAGLAKELTVTPGESGPVIDHQLTNAGTRDVTVAVWSITQFQLGGIAIAPTGAATSSTGVQADRSLVIWPYTDLSDARLSWRDAAVLVEAAPGEKIKVGVGPDPKQLGYFYDGYLFSKKVAPVGEGDYPDFGAVGQVFVNEDFCELESVGPIETLSPGSSTSLQETWSISECSDIETACSLVLDRRPT